MDFIQLYFLKPFVFIVMNLLNFSLKKIFINGGRGCPNKRPGMERIAKICNRLPSPLLFRVINNIQNLNNYIYGMHFMLR